MSPEIKADITVKADATEISKNLLQKIADTIGVFYEPTRITRKAKAEAKAKLIKTQTDIELKKVKTLAEIELNDIQQRAMTRLVHQEERKQQNIEQIITGALPLITENTSTEEIDEDWLAYFFAHCDTISDSDMQSLWSKILANEASNPGKFSKRTIDFLATISKEEANSFTKLCQFCFKINNELEILIDNPESDIYKNQGITFDLLTHLDSIGLIKFNGVVMVAQIPEIDTAIVTYFDKTRLHIKKLSLYETAFTKIGRELAPICGAQPNEEFYDYIIKLWTEQNVIVNN